MDIVEGFAGFPGIAVFVEILGHAVMAPPVHWGKFHIAHSLQEWCLTAWKGARFFSFF